MIDPPFTLRQLSLFVAAADGGSMTAAGHQAHVPQSAVSLAISDLERRWRVQLFIRHHGQGLTLTEAGRRVLGPAREVLSLASGLADVGRATGQELTGALAVAAPTRSPHFSCRGWSPASRASHRT